MNEIIQDDWNAYDLSLVQKKAGRPGVVLSRLTVYGENIAHAVRRARENVSDKGIFVIQSAALRS